MSRSPRPVPRLSRRAFSMVELLVVVAIIGMLASLVVGGYSSMTKRAKETKCVSNLRQVSAGLMSYVAENNGYLPRPTIKKGDPSNPSYDPNDANAGADYMWSKQLGPYLPQRTSSVTAPQNRVFICPSASYAGYANSDISSAYTCSAALYFFTSPTSTGSATSGPARALASVQNPAQTIFVTEGKQNASEASCPSSVNWTQASGDLASGTTAGTSYLDFRHDSKINALYGDGHVGNVTFNNRTDIARSVWEGRNY